MGLDIRVHMNARLIDEQECKVDEQGWCIPHEDVDGIRRPYNLVDFGDRASDLVVSIIDEKLIRYRCYRVDCPEPSLDFKAGSYSGYNEWRRLLSKLALGVAPEQVWHDFTSFKDLRFAELIHFADNEGVIGPTLVKKLADDFGDWNVPSDQPDWFLRTYIKFRTAFRCAAQSNGFVEWR